jgi:lactoylglutathione lyase
MAAIRFDHVHLRTSDPEGMAQWFERVLGAEILRSVEQGRPRIDIALGGMKIFVAPVTAGDGVAPPPALPCRGLDHFGLFVEGLDAVAAELKQKGVVFTKEPHSPRPGIRICFIQGPESISIELLERHAVPA